MLKTNGHSKPSARSTPTLTLWRRTRGTPRHPDRVALTATRRLFGGACFAATLSGAIALAGCSFASEEVESLGERRGAQASRLDKGTFPGGLEPSVPPSPPNRATCVNPDRGFNRTGNYFNNGEVWGYFMADRRCQLDETFPAMCSPGGGAQCTCMSHSEHGMPEKGYYCIVSWAT